MNSAIIGYTGFVGGNLVNQYHFDQFYNSKNIESIGGQQFDCLVCAGAPAVKWLANKEPIGDRENLQRLMNCLKNVEAKQMILISTVDVYPSPIEVNEENIIDLEKCQPYGKHRLELEYFLAERFDTLTIRLPGLFGQGLKKNIIYDFLNNNVGDWIHKDSVFQFYNLDNLWQDIQTALEHQLHLVNFATEPTSVYEVAKHSFGFEFTNTPEQPPARYDMRTKYSEFFQGVNLGYLYNKEEILKQIKNFVNQYPRK